MWSYFFDPSTESFPEFTQSVPIIVLSMFIGVVLAALISLYHKKVLGAFIAFLLSSGAYSEETAIRLDTTAFAKNIFVIGALRRGNAYRSVVRSVAPEGEADPSDENGRASLQQRTDRVLHSSYYIPDDLAFRAENMFLKKGTTVLSAILGILLFLIIGALSLVVIPDLIQMLKNVVASMS